MVVTVDWEPFETWRLAVPIASVDNGIVAKLREKFYKMIRRV